MQVRVKGSLTLALIGLVVLSFLAREDPTANTIFIVSLACASVYFGYLLVRLIRRTRRGTKLVWSVLGSLGLRTDTTRRADGRAHASPIEARVDVQYVSDPSVLAALNRCRVGILLSVLVFVIIPPLTLLLIVAALVTGGVTLLPALAMMLAGPLMIWLAVRSRKRMTQLFKDTVIPQMLSGVFGDVRYAPGGGIDIESVGLFTRMDRLSYGDMLEATYRGRRFAQGDAKITRVDARKELTKDSRGYLESRTVEEDTILFNGRVMRFVRPLRMSEPVHVVSHDFKTTLHGRGAPAPGWESVQTELEEFNSVFGVYSPSQIAAMALLTPPVMEKITWLNRVINRPMALCFEDGFLYVFVSMGLGEDSFEISTVRGNRAALAKLNADIQMTIDMMGILDLESETK